MFTLGSLFSGAGTCEFAAQQYGIKTLWASEIEAFPVQVTTKNFPHAKQLGDINNISGYDIDPVDIISFGSPCQGLSVAGKREGLKDDRSVLFLQAIRIIQEMRDKTNGKYPQIVIWENVLGAFSSNKGEDFKVVLEKFVKIKETNADIPRPKKWSRVGEIMGDGFSLAWRVLDAQFWGVPQRRRRIFLVVDFGGRCAGKILFEREGLSRNFAESRAAWKGFTRSIKGSFNSKIGGGVLFEPRSKDGIPRIHGDIAPTLNTAQGGQRQPCIAFNALQDPISSDNIAPCLGTGNSKTGQANIGVVHAAGFIGRQGSGAGSIGYEDDISPTLRGSQEVHVFCMATQQGGAEIAEDLCPTITAAAGMSGNNQPVICMSSKQQSQNISVDVANTLTSNDYKEPQVLCVLNDMGGDFMNVSDDLTGTLRAEARGHQPIVCFPKEQDKAMGYDRYNQSLSDDVMPTLKAVQGGDDINCVCLVKNGGGLCYSMDRAAFNQGQNAQFNIGIDDSGIAHTLVAKGPGAVAYGVDCRNATENENLSPTIQAKGKGNGYSLNCTPCVRFQMEIRRVTPTECARLQGMPEYLQILDFDVERDNQCLSVIKTKFKEETIMFWDSALFANNNTLLWENERPVVEIALLNYERLEVRIHKTGKLLGIVKSVENHLAGLQVKETGDFAALIVGMLQIAAKTQSNGGAGEFQNTINLLLQKNGSQSKAMLKSVKTESVSFAEKLQKSGADTITNHGNIFQKNDLTKITSFGYVLSAIISSIPQEILSEDSFTVRLSRIKSWTSDIPHSDSAEYKMWGNGMALPCVMYVFEGVKQVLISRWLDELLED